MQDVLAEAQRQYLAGRPEQAARLYRRAVAADPGNAILLLIAGVCAGQSGDFRTAARLLRLALAVEPREDAAANLASACLAAAADGMDHERPGEAERAAMTAAALDPCATTAFAIIGRARLNQRRPIDAYKPLVVALRLAPDRAEGWSDLAVCRLALRLHAPAEAALFRALALRPDFAPAHHHLGSARQELDSAGEAKVAHRRAVRCDPSLVEARFAACMAELQPLYGDAADIAASRARYAAALRALRTDLHSVPALAAVAARAVGSAQPFYLAYQGMDDRALQQEYGALIADLMERRFPAAPMPVPAGGGDPVRVGIVCGQLREHSVWKLPLRGWLRTMDRRRFRLHAYHTGAERDGETDRVRSLVDRFVQGPLPVGRWRAEILADAPHVILFPEVGMDRVVPALAAQRLAPVQCTTFGHPVTTGLPTIDVYLSSDLMEPADAAGHYTELLLRLPGLGLWWEAPEPAPPRDRGLLGIERDAVAYWCCQSLYKFQPAYDDVFARIAQFVPAARFMFIEHHASAGITQRFQARLRRSFAAFGLDADRHCRFLPRMDSTTFAAAAGGCDVFLDSVGWSGMNSLLESLSYDLPVVTLPGPFMRGRHASAILGMMGITDTIATDVKAYVETAARLGLDPSWRMELRQRTAARKHRLVRDDRVPLALEAFLRAAATHPGRFRNDRGA